MHWQIGGILPHFVFKIGKYHLSVLTVLQLETAFSSCRMGSSLYAYKTKFCEMYKNKLRGLIGRFFNPL